MKRIFTFNEAHKRIKWQKEAGDTRADLWTVESDVSKFTDTSYWYKHIHEMVIAPSKPQCNLYGY